MKAFGASLLLLSCGCSRRMLGCFHGAAPAICWSQCSSTRPRHPERNSLSLQPGQLVRVEFESSDDHFREDRPAAGGQFETVGQAVCPRATTGHMEMLLIAAVRWRHRSAESVRRRLYGGLQGKE